MTLMYAIPDLHGRLDLLQAALVAIREQDPTAQSERRIVTLGDYVDRGPESRGVIEYLMDRPEIRALRGNHEDMLLGFLDGEYSIGDYLTNGGGATLLSYGQKLGERPDPGVVPPEHRVWLRTLPYMHVTPTHVFVHAGVDPAVPLDQQTVTSMTWRLYRFWETWHHGVDEHGNELRRHVVHGHHAHRQPEMYEGRTNLDTDSWSTGRLCVGVFDSEAGGVEIFEVWADGERPDQR